MLSFVKERYFPIISAVLVLWAGYNLFRYLVHGEPFNPAPVYLLAGILLVWTAGWYYDRRAEKIMEEHKRQIREKLKSEFHAF